jgi:hydrogenase 3 maturation protease
MRGDDMVGPYTVDLLKERLDSGGGPEGFDLEIIDADVMPENFSKPMRESGADLILFVDAVDMNLEPGTIRKVPRDLIDATIPCSHNLPMSYVMGYINEKIKRVELVGVQISTTGLFEEMTLATKKACTNLVELIWNGEIDSVPVHSRDVEDSDKEATNYCW